MDLYPLSWCKWRKFFDWPGQPSVGTCQPCATNQKTCAIYTSIGDALNSRDLGGYRDLVETYTLRKLTYESDMRAAFSGVASMWSQSAKSALFFEIPELYFESALRWVHKGEVRRNSTDSPSWSWTAWTGEVTWGRKFFKFVDFGLLQFHIYTENFELVKVHSGVPSILELNPRYSDQEIPYKHVLNYARPSRHHDHRQIPTLLKPGTLIFRARIAYIPPPRGWAPGLQMKLNGYEDYTSSDPPKLLTCVAFGVKQSGTLFHVIYWIVQFDQDDIAQRVGICSTRITEWLKYSPEERTIFLR
ncbi:MAG: hypothetical protein Q9227_000984 [Pyrenula ochraceoflavens]